MKNFKSVDEYIKKADKDKKDFLIEVRKIVLSLAENAEEEIAYGMPGYKLNSVPFLYFAAMKGHLGFYPTPGPIKTCAKLLKDYSTSKGCIRIPYTKPLPSKLLETIVKERIKEIKQLKIKKR